MQGFPASLGLAHCACTGLEMAVDVGVDNANSSILRFRVFEATLVAVEFNVPTTEVFCLHGFVDWCRFASTSIHCPSAADMGEVLLARLLLATVPVAAGAFVCLGFEEETRMQQAKLAEEQAKLAEEEAKLAEEIQQLRKRV